MYWIYPESKPKQKFNFLILCKMENIVDFVSNEMNWHRHTETHTINSVLKLVQLISSCLSVSVSLSFSGHQKKRVYFYLWIFSIFEEGKKTTMKKKEESIIVITDKHSAVLMFDDDDCMAPTTTTTVVVVVQFTSAFLSSIIIIINSNKLNYDDDGYDDG